MKLVIGVLAAGLVLFAATPVMAQSQSGAVNIGGIVAGQPPSAPPEIESPAPGQNLQEDLVTVRGTCLEGLVVKLFRNGIFAGSALCDGEGNFALEINLVEGRNDLTARQYDLLSQPSPASDTLTVFYTPASGQPELTTDQPEATAEFQLVIDYDYNFQGIFAGEPFNLPVHFLGGAAPYAVSVDWGDGDTSVHSREDTSQFHTEHTYQNAGAQTVRIRVSDSEGQEAFLQFVLIVNGGPVTALPVKTSEPVEANQVWNAVLFSSLITGTASFTAGFLVATFWESLRIKIRGSLFK